MSLPTTTSAGLLFEAFDLVAPPVRVWTPSEGALYVNPAWLALTGTTRADNDRDGWLALVHEDDRPAVLDALKRQAQATADFSLRYRLRGKDGDFRRVEDTARPWVESATRRVRGLVHTCQTPSADSPETGAAPAGGRPAFSQWAHDLRGPLNAILGWSDLLSTGQSDPEVLSRGLQSIAKNAREQAAIIRRLTEQASGERS